MKNSHFVLSIIVLFFAISKAKTQTREEKGLEIAKTANIADQGFQDYRVEFTMTLKNRNGQTSTRFLENRTLEKTADGDWSLITFNSPKDVKGTATLTYTHKDGPDDQWLYLPSIKRVKRISSSNKSGPFMGSEFAYEDLSSQEVEKYTYKYIREEIQHGETIYIVERYPLDPKSGYKRQIGWINKDKGYRIEKIEYYDRKNALLKTLTFSGYKLYLGKHWRAANFHMINHQTGKETILAFDEYKFKTGLADNDFSQNSLQRAGR